MDYCLGSILKGGLDIGHHNFKIGFSTSVSYQNGGGGSSVLVAQKPVREVDHLTVARIKKYLRLSHFRSLAYQFRDMTLLSSDRGHF